MNFFLLFFKFLQQNDMQNVLLKSVYLQLIYRLHLLASSYSNSLDQFSILKIQSLFEENKDPNGFLILVFAIY